jgi:hypothetical protein
MPKGWLHLESFASTGGYPNRARTPYWLVAVFFCLLPDGAIPMVPTAPEEAVTHHALAKQKKENDQDNDKKQSRHPQPRRISSCRLRRFHRNEPPSESRPPCRKPIP